MPSEAWLEIAITNVLPGDTDTVPCINWLVVFIVTYKSYVLGVQSIHLYVMN